MDRWSVVRLFHYSLSPISYPLTTKTLKLKNFFKNFKECIIMGIRVNGDDPDNGFN